MELFSNQCNLIEQQRIYMKFLLRKNLFISKSMHERMSCFKYCPYLPISTKKVKLHR